MASPKKAMSKATARLEVRRRELETRLDNLRRSLDREFGWAPAAKVWGLPLIAFACGLALGLRRARGRDDGSPSP